jgi:hypothetical protein
MMWRWQFRVAIGDRVPELFDFGSEVNREAQADTFSPTCSVPNLFWNNFRLTRDLLKERL